MTTTIAVFNQSGLNGNGIEECSDENSNLLSIIQNEIDNGGDYAINNAIVNFTDLANLQAQLDASSFFFMTDMENEDPDDTGFLPTGAMDILREYVEGGGIIVQTATEEADDVDFLNNIFDLNLSNVLGTTSWNKNNANTAGTDFDNGPASLGAPSATDSIDASALTNGSYTSYYDDGGNADSVFGKISFGDGTVYFIGFDYFDTGFATDWGDGEHVDCDENDSPYVTYALPATLATAAAEAQATAAAEAVANDVPPAQGISTLTDGGLLALAVMVAGAALLVKRLWHPMG